MWVMLSCGSGGWGVKAWTLWCVSLCPRFFPGGLGLGAGLPVARPSCGGGGLLWCLWGWRFVVCWWLLSWWVVVSVGGLRCGVLVFGGAWRFVAGW